MLLRFTWLAMLPAALLMYAYESQENLATELIPNPVTEILPPL